MAYVDDLVEGTLLAMESDRAVGEIINLGNAEEMSVIDAARLIHRLADTGRELRVKFVPMKEVFGDYKDIVRRVPDLTKARKILGYRPKYSLEDAIRLSLEATRSDMPPQAQAGGG
jgi:UDP-glucose 4-epimerase